MQSDRPEPIAVASSTAPMDDAIYLGSQNPAVRGLERIIAEIAPTSIPVLLVGENGSGKEVVAVRIHRLSQRRSESFVKVVCTRFASECLEEPMDGWSSNNGIRSLLSTGTVFLDEVGDLDLASQTKLLNVMPDGDAAPQGGCLQPRVISATSHNLEEGMRFGRFREELYYRLNGVCLRLPPLRQRKEDIAGLADFFLTRYAVQFGRPKPFLSSRMLSAFLEYSWPGNIRQLENAVKKIVVSGDERLAQADLEQGTWEWRPPSGSGEGLSLKQAARAASRQAERQLILKALERTRWNRKRAAKELQISYKALLYKLKQIGLEDSTDSFSRRGERE